MSPSRVLYFDLLRSLAALFVVGIHVLGPFRHQYGVIHFDHWLVAVGLNSISRWAVPVFIMVSGALLIRDARPFDGKYYLQRRVMKVVIPFLIWSVFYAYLSGWDTTGFDWGNVKERLSEMPHEATYYHLGFFYYFIPLYALVPFFHWAVRRYEWFTPSYLLLWLFSSVAYLFYWNGVWSYSLWLYSGYLLLGYYLSREASHVWLWGLLGSIGLMVTAYMVIHLSVGAGEYTVKRWLSYKTINTVVIAGMIFVLCRHWGEHLSPMWQKVIRFTSRYSLGIYILHPLVLWPMHHFELNFSGHPLWVIPLWIIMSYIGALVMSWICARFRLTRWLLP
ncbi:acyltransferase [Vibrio gazogenes]|uniref:Surface polysaccharide O-acyltransferase, integral membrane enzyme n=1 Tax=Vibrio gazogenes DSM 21264 = NBRC 103151 TaxID=1123492 RepID=A0A1M5BTZ1_VIBGA|nr:acyltransferase family protein [Vibrio gazogenes]USP13652.1 acyltransferase family protein [Vibrio gazogenes]SHF46033.1 Surface polysaccharide O-acyltransferase, integral membrane enzyme [Vibrio gazogenes DSM 21264] [Vibrio gazogenes DSM 21264 = NBRC 103151]SJN55725.1 Acyltransferase family protein [Vibrio gazogenes]